MTAVKKHSPSFAKASAVARAAMADKAEGSAKMPSGLPRGASSGHLAILASAGSGKTTRLTHRYIQLLADKDLEVTPGRICALTFTRKAAGEIFDRIVECLCKGAADSKEAAALAGKIFRPDLDPQEFARLLGLFLDNLHRAVIGTMDSFVFGVARAFPIELGIPMEFAAADSDKAQAKAMRQDILAGILSARGAGGSGAREFLEAFKKATFGAEEKGLEDILSKMISTFHLSYRFCPDKSKWGNAQLVWTGKNKINFKIYSQAKLLDQPEHVKQWIEAEGQKEKGIDKRLQKSLPAIADALAAYNPTTPWNDKLFGCAAFEQLLGERDALRLGDATIIYNRKPVGIPPAPARALAVLVDNLVAVEIARALEKTAGLHNLLGIYDRAYEKVSRESGRFSFTDIQYLLALGDISRNVSAISRKQQEGRLFIDYRMDSRLDHWLLDEFQDTSDLQWAIFSNLVSELVQGDPEGRERSFFYVGDVKQSIYRWRGGNPGLFLDIQKQYNQVSQVIRTETMSKTYRCSQPVVEAVNKVFADLPDNLPAETIAAWKTVWSEHKTLNEKAKGYVAFLQHPPASENNEEQEAEARYRLVADLLNEIQPIKRGIGVGILTRTNEACSDLVNVLRRECPEIGFVHEGKAGIVENQLAQGLLALIRLAAHPGDEFAWQYVRMSPLAEALKKENINRNNIALRLLTEIESHGFRSFITEWSGRLEAVCALNEYGRQCLARLEKSAAAFDITGSRRCNRFLEFIEDYEVHEEAARGSVRIMTIHQAKGLGFDMVILPQLQHRTRMNMVKADWTDKDMLYGGKLFDPGWVLKSPRISIAESDPVLSARLQAIDGQHCFDWLCLLYVAMTRARNALYMITSPVKKSETFRPASLLKLQLTGKTEPEAEYNIKIHKNSCARLYSPGTGDEKWYESFPKTSAPEEADSPDAPGPADFAKRDSRRKVLQRSEPSKQESFDRKASDFFTPVTRDVLDFGSAIHELFEKIEWLDAEADAEAIISSWRPSRPWDQKVYEDVLKQFRKCLKSEEVRQALARPEGKVELWREKSFEIIMDGQWVSGIFDRVVITRDESGKQAAAVILDFKSNRDLDTEASIRNKAKHYQPQMEIYRRALSGILGLAEDRIATELLFTVPASVFRQ